MLIIAEVKNCPNACGLCESISQSFVNLGKLQYLDDKVMDKKDHDKVRQLVEVCPHKLIKVHTT